MIAYVDTHIAVRLANAEIQLLTEQALDAMAANSLRISPMVVLELEYLFELGRISISANDVVRKLEYELDLRICDLDFQKIMDVACHEKWTRDPFDRVIVAHAKANGLSPLISADRLIRENYLRAVW
ncbi:MAG TPA: PIN domain-containing protein [Acidobacteriaceae bacterium]|jgi:PIN domain nuclease of toxin-antitoxin system|nr:PIN domain-containing protein [Acidobacteriaceae bacterium]